MDQRGTMPAPCWRRSSAHAAAADGHPASTVPAATAWRANDEVRIVVVRVQLVRPEIDDAYPAARAARPDLFQAKPAVIGSDSDTHLVLRGASA